VCKVVNARQFDKRPTADRVYVGRKWGNPFVLGRALRRHREIPRMDRPAAGAQGALHELRGKNLVCSCAPERWHAEELIELANRSITHRSR
jgi:hypothetical protein